LGLAGAGAGADEVDSLLSRNLLMASRVDAPS
jgi:hypothetical protein